jgi:antitoxin MazE
MRTLLIRIGNSRGIRIPKLLIDECGLRERVHLQVVNNKLVISAEDAPRQGWSEAFRKAGVPDKDGLLLELPPNDFDREEWRW